MSNKDEVLTFSDALARGTAQARKQRGLSQAELAERCGMHRNAVSNIERGTTAAGSPSDPQLSTVLKLAGALNVSPAKLIFGAVLTNEEVETTPGVFLHGLDAFRWFAGYAGDMAKPVRALELKEAIAEQTTTLRQAEGIAELATGDLVRRTAEQQAETARTLIVELSAQLANAMAELGHGQS